MMVACWRTFNHPPSSMNEISFSQPRGDSRTAIVRESGLCPSSTRVSLYLALKFLSEIMSSWYLVFPPNMSLHDITE